MGVALLCWIRHERGYISASVLKVGDVSRLSEEHREARDDSSEEGAVRVQRGGGSIAAALPVDRIHISNISLTHFHDHYFTTQTPVVITGLTENWPARQWSLDTLAEACSNEPVFLQRRGLRVIQGLPQEHKKELDRELRFTDNITLEEVVQQLEKGMTFGEFAQYMKTRRGRTTHKVRDGKSFANFLVPYNMHDEQIRGKTNPRGLRGGDKIFCEKLLEEVTIARFFQPVGVVTPLTCRERARLWVAPAGSRAYPAHLHTVPANIMSVMLQGHKRWTFWRYGVAHTLEPEFQDSNTEDGDEMFWADPQARVNEDHHTNAERYEVTLGPGELLYVPCELVHHVFNEDETIAVSYALMDERSGRCAANLKAEGSFRFGNPKLPFNVELRGFEAHKERQESAGRRLLEYPEHLDQDLSWKTFNERYCTGEMLRGAQDIQKAVKEAVGIPTWPAPTDPQLVGKGKGKGHGKGRTKGKGKDGRGK